MKLSIGDYRSPVGVQKWVAELGVTDSPMARHAITNSLRFFANRMPRLSVELAADFLRATDTSRKVETKTLTRDERIIAFRKQGEAEFKLFYTRPGYSKHTSGINPRGRSAVHFVVRNPCAALESYTTGAIDIWSYPSSMTIAVRSNSTGYMASGGGRQLIIPEAHRYLEVVPTP